MKNIYFLFCLMFLSLSCRTTKNTAKTSFSISDLIANSNIPQEGFSGIEIIDLEDKQVLFEKNSAKYFTAASNVKILNLYISLNLLSDSIPLIQYVVHQDSLIFWGTGNPDFFHPDLPMDSTLLHFFNNRKEQLYFSSHNFQDQPYGPGWSWDDYGYAFQVEKSSFPIYGNVIEISKTSNQDGYEISPKYFEKYLLHDPKEPDIGAKVIRQKNSNRLLYNQQTAMGQSFDRKVPFQYSDSLFIQLLSEALARKVQLYPIAMMPPPGRTKIYQIKTDSLIQQMMQESDNFVAEQLLLIGAGELTDTLKVSRVIEYAKTNLFEELPDIPIMRDGSGLSRYNLLTPRTITTVLKKLYENIPTDRLFSFFAAGGQSGTLQSWYDAGEPAFVHGKTGSMSNVFCLSGYLVTQKGRRLAFSFMHNHFVGSSRPIREELAKILKEIHLNY